MAGNRPTAAELLKATHEFLANEAMAAIDAADVKFKLRVALNVLKLLERELLQGPDNDLRERARLQGLLGSNEESLEALNDQLCRDIRAGRFDDRLGELLPCLQECTLDKLAVDNPRYSTYRQLLGSE